MDKEKIIRKLTSRKFWVAVAGFVAAMLTVMHVDEGTAAQVTALVMAAASVVSYIVGEGMADAAGIQTKKESNDGEG